MGSDDLFKKRKKDRRRKKETREIKPKILIVCEGEKTEPYYFKSFKITSAKIKICGVGMNTESLVKHTKDLYDKYNQNFDHVWCVFDRDDFKKNSFLNAFSLAKKYDFNIAYSNEAFELWYLLHFEFYNSALHRNDYIKKLNQLLRRKYEKNDAAIYDEIKNKQEFAITNAKKLLDINKGKNPFD